MDLINISYKAFLYKIGQWIRDEKADLSRQSAFKLLSMLEVTLNNLDETKKQQVYKSLNDITISNPEFRE